MGKHNVKHPMMANEFVAQFTFEWIKVYADMDHAGDVRYDECCGTLIFRWTQKYCQAAMQREA